MSADTWQEEAAHMLDNGAWRTDAERLWGEEGAAWLSGSLARVNEGARQMDGTTLETWTKYRNAGGDMSLADFASARALPVAKAARDRAHAALVNGGFMADSEEQADFDRHAVIESARRRMTEPQNHGDKDP